MGKPKIAIIGAGIAGLSCAIECEKLGAIPDIFERNNAVGWICPSMVTWPAVSSKRYGRNSIEYLKDTYDININFADFFGNIVKDF